MDNQERHTGLMHQLFTDREVQKGFGISLFGFGVSELKLSYIMLQIGISDIKLWTAWLEFSIKFVSLLVILIVLLKNINSYRNSMKAKPTRPAPPEGGDNEDGSGSDIDPDD